VRGPVLRLAFLRLAASLRSEVIFRGARRIRAFWRWLPDYETCAAPQRGPVQTSASLLDFSWMRSSFASRERRGKPALESRAGPFDLPLALFF
jgi:hypothetical protein